MATVSGKAGRWRGGSEVTQSSVWLPLRDDGDCGSGRPAEAVGVDLEWTGRWPGARASEISHLHRAGIMTMSSLPPAQAQLAARATRAWGMGHGAWVDLKQVHKIWNG